MSCGTGLCDTLEVLEGDLASLIIIKEPEGLQNLIFRVAVQDLVGHHLQEPGHNALIDD